MLENCETIVKLNENWIEEVTRKKKNFFRRYKVTDLTFLKIIHSV